MNNRFPLVSVVIPAYNHADYLDEAIRSVLEQDYPNLELLVLNDGSTDATRQVLTGYGERFYWETHDNMGQAETLNKGWRMSKGKILAYLSPDDILLPGAVTFSVEHLLANPGVVMTYCDYGLIDANSAFLRRVDAPVCSYREMVAKFVCPPGPGAFFLRSAFDDAGFWDGSFKQLPDYDFWLRLGLRGRFSKVPDMLAMFRVHETSLSFAAADNQRSEEYARVISDYYKIQRVPADVLAAKKEALSTAYVFTARSHLRSRRYAKGLARLAEGIFMYPKNLVRVRTLRIVAHGLLNHVRHEILRKIVKVRKS